MNESESMNFALSNSFLDLRKPVVGLMQVANSLWLQSPSYRVYLCAIIKQHPWEIFNIVLEEFANNVRQMPGAGKDPVWKSFGQFSSSFPGLFPLKLGGAGKEAPTNFKGKSPGNEVVTIDNIASIYVTNSCSFISHCTTDDG